MESDLDQSGLRRIQSGPRKQNYCGLKGSASSFVLFISEEFFPLTNRRIEPRSLRYRKKCGSERVHKNRINRIT